MQLQIASRESNKPHDWNITRAPTRNAAPVSSVQHDASFLAANAHGPDGLHQCSNHPARRTGRSQAELFHQFYPSSASIEPWFPSTATRQQVPPRQHALAGTPSQRPPRRQAEEVPPTRPQLASASINSRSRGEHVWDLDPRPASSCQIRRQTKFCSCPHCFARSVTSCRKRE